MKKRGIIFTIVLVSLVSVFLTTSCNKKEGLNPEYITEFHQIYFGDKKSPLKTGDLRLYVDYSTCIAQAMNDGSTFYKDMLPILQRATSYYSIKGPAVSLDSTISSGEDIYKELCNIQEVNYADLPQAADNIANGNSEAILVTDGEYYENNEANSHNNDPYLHKAFKKWLSLGREIFIYCEPYKESYRNKTYDKKRFYFVFTDSEVKGNVYDIIVNQIPDIEKRTDVLQYHLTSSHSLLSTSGQTNSSIPNENLSAEILEACGYYEVQDWSTPNALSWKNIKKYIIEAVDDETGNELKNGEPIISGLSLDRNTKGSCFRIDDIYLEVSNLTEQYQKYCDARAGGQQPAQIIKENPIGDPKNLRMNNFMILDQDEFKRTGIIKIFFDKENFDPTYLQSNSTNLLKIDIKVKQFTNAFKNNSDARSRFEFDVLGGQSGQTNQSVVKSIDAVLAEHDIRDMMQGRTLYTIYVFSNPSDL